MKIIKGIETLRYFNYLFPFWTVLDVSALGKDEIISTIGLPPPP